MKPTFNQHVWDLIEKERNSTVVVDNLHAYAIIKDRLDVFWQIARQLDDEDDQMAVLGALIGIGSGAQLAAEGLGLVPEQLRGEVRETDAERRVDAAHQIFSRIVATIDQEKKQVRSLQRDTPRFAFEFDLDTLRDWQAQAEGLAE
jgi:hypothetical protein